jgi:hypothetical protein
MADGQPTTRIWLVHSTRGEQETSMRSCRTSMAGFAWVGLPPDVHLMLAGPRSRECPTTRKAPDAGRRASEMAQAARIGPRPGVAGEHPHG